MKEKEAKGEDVDFDMIVDPSKGTKEDQLEDALLEKRIEAARISGKDPGPP